MTDTQLRYLFACGTVLLFLPLVRHVLLTTEIVYSWSTKTPAHAVSAREYVRTMVVGGIIMVGAWTLCALLRPEMMLTFSFLVWAAYNIWGFVLAAIHTKRDRTS